MRISEFSRAASAYHKQSLIAFFAPITLALVCIIAYAPFRGPLETFLSSKFDASAVDFLIALPMAVPMVIAFAFIIPLARRIERTAGIPCPHCGKSLANQRGIVIASRNCPYCGKRVIEDET